MEYPVSSSTISCIKFYRILHQVSLNFVSGFIILEESEKGNCHLARSPRKRGSSPKNPGISDNKAKVIVTADWKNDLNMTCCGHGCLTKKDIAESLHTPLPKDVALCSDGHVSYKVYASDNRLKHVVLRKT